MKHNFEQRKKNRVDKTKQLVDKNEKKSGQFFEQAHNMAEAIPFGQPILVGHHSEKRDRNYRRKIHNTLCKAFEAQDKAKYFERKAESIENNTAVSSDDPQAIIKVERELESLIANHEFMKAANKYVRKNAKEKFLQLK